MSGLDVLTFPTTTAAGQTFDFDGELTAEESHPYAFSAASTFSNTVSVTATDRAGNITTTLAAIFNDNLAPTVALTVPTTAGLDFSVAWAATDAASGVRAFNLGYGSSASGPWTAWLTNTTDLSAAFLGLPDESYYFRVQAIDNVGNVSSWRVEGPVTINTVTKYYYHGGQRVAMRQGDGVYYLSGDHLGSTSLTTDNAGQVVHQARYLPYGQERWSSGVTVTDFGFTSQRNEAGFGLYDYNARFYSARLGRFVSADTIVPEPSNSQAWNRYGYANNNPIRFTDPTGHYIFEEKPDDLYFISPKNSPNDEAMRKSDFRCINDCHPSKLTVAINKLKDYGADIKAAYDQYQKDGTFSVSAASSFSGFGMEFVFGLGLFHTDEKGNFAIGTSTFAYGANTTWSADVGPNVMLTNAADLSELGEFYTSSGIIFPIVPGIGGNMDYIGGRSGKKGDITGVNPGVSFGIQPPPMLEKISEIGRNAKIPLDPTTAGVHGNGNYTIPRAILGFKHNGAGGYDLCFICDLSYFRE